MKHDNLFYQKEKVTYEYVDKLKKTIVFVGDDNGVTAFFKERTDIIVEGETIEDAKQNLFDLHEDVLNYEHQIKQLANIL